MIPATGQRPAHSTTRGTNFPGQIEELKSIAGTVLQNVGIEYSPNRINRLCVRFVERTERNGFAFFDFLANSVQLDAATRRRALADPEIARVISYADHTGETAVSNVMRSGGASR